jgi:hypothetical protein
MTSSNHVFRSTFFFVWALPVPGLRSLAGDEPNEPKDHQLPPLREDFVRRPLEREAFFDTADDQVPSMRLPEGVEMRDATNASGKTAALHVPKLRLFILKVVIQGFHTSRFDPYFFC